MASQKPRFYRASIINPLSDTKCDYLPDGVLVVTGERIEAVLSYEAATKRYGERLKCVDLRDSLILPGFYDMHFHWVQDDVREMPKDSLLQWLESYTFPAEMKFADKSYARAKARVFFKRLSATGTVGGACYSSIHGPALDAAMKEAKGDFVIGNVLMNMNSPKELTQTEAESLQLVKDGIRKFRHRYCLTPRFAISTSPIVMAEAGKLADRAKCFKQSHLSETPQEIDFVLSLYRAFPGFEDVASYTEIYQRTNMLGPRSLMGHGIHLSPEELKVLAKTRTSLVHCPTSNAPLKELGLGSGLFSFKAVEASKVRWALGSDIGGGPYLSMFDVMASFVAQNQRKKISGATYVKALYRATLAGAEILGEAKTAGNLRPGKYANFIVVSKPRGGGKSAEETLRKLVGPLKSRRHAYGGLVKMTAYRGRKLHPK